MDRRRGVAVHRRPFPRTASAAAEWPFDAGFAAALAVAREPSQVVGILEYALRE